MIRVAVFLLAIFALTACASPLQRVADRVHDRFTYVHDLKQYGVPDYWIASERGDCEDFALLAQQILASEGYYGRVVSVFTPDGDLHAVLLHEGMVIDNTSPFVRPWDATGYRLHEALPVVTVHSKKIQASAPDWGAVRMTISSQTDRRLTDPSAAQARVQF